VINVFQKFGRTIGLNVFSSMILRSFIEEGILMEMPVDYRLCVEMSCGYCNKTELKEKEKIGLF